MKFGALGGFCGEDDWVVVVEEEKDNDESCEDGDEDELFRSESGDLFLSESVCSEA